MEISELPKLEGIGPCQGRRGQHSRLARSFYQDQKTSLDARCGLLACCRRGVTIGASFVFHAVNNSGDRRPLNVHAWAIDFLAVACYSDTEIGRGYGVNRLLHVQIAFHCEISLPFTVNSRIVDA